ncbi:MAG: glycosyltransferase family 4 protein [Candidatus Hodarchaeota archaeon]
MKVLHVCDNLNPVGGYETYLDRIADHLTELNLQMHIVTQKHSYDTPDVICRPNYRVYTLPGNFLEAKKWILWSYPEKERETQAQRLFSANDLRENCEKLENELLAVIDHIKPDIIHAHSTYIVFGRVLKQLDLKIPLIATIHGLPKPLVLPGQVRTIDYAELKKFQPYDQILAVSKAVKAALKQEDILAKVLYSGIDTSLFQPLNLPKKWDLAFCGRIDKIKGVDLFPKIVNNLNKKDRSIRIVIAGSGPEETSLKRTLKSENLLSHFDFLGILSNSFIPEILSQSRIFIYPSRSEPFGLSILEAMACELPTLTSSIEGPKEIIEHQVDGVLIEPEDTHTYTMWIQKLLSTNSLSFKIGKQAREKVVRTFNIKDHIKRLVAVYNEAIDQKKAQSL